MLVACYQIQIVVNSKSQYTQNEDGKKMNELLGQIKTAAYHNELEKIALRMSADAVKNADNVMRAAEKIKLKEVTNALNDVFKNAPKQPGKPMSNLTKNILIGTGATALAGGTATGGYFLGKGNR